MSDDTGDVNGQDAKYWRNHPTTEKTLRQFLKMESGAYTRPDYREHYDRSMRKTDPVKLEVPEQCLQCDYIAETDTEVTWHEHRNPGHECLPGVRPQVALCPQCGNPLDKAQCKTLNCKLRFEP